MQPAASPLKGSEELPSRRPLRGQPLTPDRVHEVPQTLKRRYSAHARRYKEVTAEWLSRIREVVVKPSLDGLLCVGQALGGRRRQEDCPSVSWPAHEVGRCYAARGRVLLAPPSRELQPGPPRREVHVAGFDVGPCSPSPARQHTVN